MALLKDLYNTATKPFVMPQVTPLGTQTPAPTPTAGAPVVNPQQKPVVDVGLTPAQKAQYDKTLSMFSGNQVNYNTPIGASQLNQPSGLVVPPPVNTNTQNNALNSASEQAVANANVPTPTTPTPTVTPEQKRRNDAIDKLLGVTTSIAEKSTDIQKLQEEKDIAGKTEAVNEINKRILNISAAYDRRLKAIEANDTGALASGVDIERTRVSKERSEAIAALTLEKAAATGDLETANNIIDTAIKAKYEPLENELSTWKTLLDVYSNDMTESEKFTATQKFQEAQQKVSDNKQLQRDVLNAAQANGQSSIASEIIKLDPSSETFAQDIARLQAKVQTVTTGTGGTLLTDTGKPMNDTQATSYGYAQRLEDADRTINSIGEKFTGVSGLIGERLPNILQSAERQQFEQAKRNFVNAVLRRESGAVISPSEFENAQKQYFPQPGDSQEVLVQKKSNRDQVIENLYRSAGVSGQIKQQNVSTPEGLRAKYNY